MFTSGRGFMNIIIALIASGTPYLVNLSIILFETSIAIWCSV